MKGLGPRKSVDKLSEDEEVEVSMSEEMAIAISRNLNNGSDSLGNSSSTPDKRSMETRSSGLSKNDDGDDEEDVGTFQRGASNSSFSRRASLRTAVRDKRSSRRNYSLKKKKVAPTDPEKQFEPNQGWISYNASFVSSHVLYPNVASLRNQNETVCSSLVSSHVS